MATIVPRVLLDSPFVLDTEQTATGTETEFDFTPPVGTKRITILMQNLVPNTASDILIQIGDSGGRETTGYISTGGTLRGASTAAVDDSTIGFLVEGDSFTSGGCTSTIILNAVDEAGTKWVYSGTWKSHTNKVGVGAGNKALDTVLTSLRISMLNGTDTFASGSVNVLYEG